MNFLNYIIDRGNSLICKKTKNLKKINYNFFFFFFYFYFYRIINDNINENHIIKNIQSQYININFQNNYKNTITQFISIVQKIVIIIIKIEILNNVIKSSIIEKRSFLSKFPDCYQVLTKKKKYDIN